MFARHSLFTTMILLSSLLGSAWGQSAKPMTLTDLAKYTGSDRGRLLYDGAKKEGKFLWYTSLIANKEIVKIFESKYPGITVEDVSSEGHAVGN
jgi:ABC-type glycerol-3-phosphate transport system substrate-binding protein